MSATGKRAAIVVCILLVAVSVIFSKFKVSFDLGLILPEPVSKFEKLLHYQLNNNASSHIVFLGFSGLPIEELAAFNLRITQKLRQSGTFSAVTNSAASLSESTLALLEENRYLLTHNNLSEQFSVTGFKSALKARLEGLLSSSAAIEKRYLRKDPTGEIITLLDDWQGKISRHKRLEERFGVWFSDDYKRTLILLEIAADISDMDNQVAAIMVIRSIFDAIKLPGLVKVMTGPAAFATESGEDIQADIRNLTLVAGALIVLFFWAAYRSTRMVVLVISPLLVGIVIATATVLVWQGSIHGITLAFGITLAGVAVDYPIHLLTGMNGDPAHNNARIIKIWRTLRLGVFSTVIAYAAFLVSGFGGMQQLGLFTIVGLVAAALFSRWALPVLPVQRAERKIGLLRLHQRLKVLGQSAPKLRWLVLCTLVFAVVALVFTHRPVLHLNVDSLSPIKNQRLEEGKLLRADLGFWYGGSMMLVTAHDKEGVLQFSESIQSDLDGLVDDQAIDGYDMVAYFLPSLERQALRKSQIASSETLRANLEQASAELPFKKGLFEPFFKEVSATAGLALVEPLALGDTTIGRKLNPLLFDFEDEAGGVILLHGVNDEERLRILAGQHEELFYMNLKSASTALVARSVDRVLVIMLICFAIIFFVLALSFKSLRRPLKILVPALSAALGTATVLVFSGNPLSIFHLISLLLVVGLGLDYALFFNRLPENNDEWDTTFRALWVCGITTIIVFGVLMFSHTPPLQAIGITVGIGTLMSIVFAAMWAATPETVKD